MEDPGYEYLHCDLLDKAILTIITLRVKFFSKQMPDQHL